jgi:lipopolysaccharide/colanic/teichoic acid biosynthesis glycosyltransferase
MKSRTRFSHFDSERLFLLAVDLICLHGSTWLTWTLRYRSPFFSDPEPFALPLTAYLLLDAFWILLFALRGQYRKLYHVSRWKSMIEVLRSTVVGLFLLLLASWEPGQTPGAGKLLLPLYAGVVFLGAAFGRVAFRTVQKQLLKRGIGLRPTIIVGDGERAQQLYYQFLNHPAMGHLPLGLLRTPAPEKADGTESGSASAVSGSAADEKDTSSSVSLSNPLPPPPVLGDLKDLEPLLKQHQVRELIVTDARRDVLFPVIDRGWMSGAEVFIVPDLYDLVLGNVKATGIWGMPTIQVFPQLMPPWGFLLKRTIDIIASLFFLILGAPLLLLVALIPLESPGGSALFRQTRVGKDGRTFRLLKFRTMHPQCSDTKSDDDRITRLGHFLRRYRIDEWPQFWNILWGQMALVGPRPEQQQLVDAYIRRMPLYARRHNVRPGLTGWAQVRQAYGESLRDVDSKLSLDLFYLENMTIGLDLKIVLYTIRTILRGEGA